MVAGSSCGERPFFSIGSSFKSVDVLFESFCVGISGVGERVVYFDLCVFAGTQRSPSQDS